MGPKSKQQQKSSKEGSNDGKKKGNASTPHCPCPHPYKCECGNRPPRPSPGHKWDPEAQAWGGKGHKQKGASGQTATVAANAVTTTVGKTKVEQWQRLPTQLLDDYCKRQKRRGPQYERRNVSDKGKVPLFKYKVVLPDAKDPMKNLVYEPSEPVENDEQAKEEGALLALVHLTPSLPHERKLPEPYRTTWLHAIESMSKAKATDNSRSTSSSNDRNEPVAGETSRSGDTTQRSGQAKASTRLAMATSYTSQAERRRQQDEIRRARNDRIRRHEAIRLANLPHKVHMCASIRNQIRNLLRGDTVDLAAIDGDDERGESDDDNDKPARDNGGDESGDDATAYIMERLRDEGFAKRHIRAAIRGVSNATSDVSESDWERMYGRCLQWLLSHLDDDQLPEGFDAQAGMLDVIAPTKGSVALGAKNRTTDAGSARPQTSQWEPTEEDETFARTFGTVLSDAQRVRQHSLEQGRSADDVLWDCLCALAGYHAKDEGAALSEASGSADEAKRRLDEELETLEAIFGSECEVTRSNGRTVVSIQLSDHDKALEVLLDDVSYPFERPSRCLIRGKNWEPDGSGVACHVELIKFIAGLELGEPMLFAIHGEVLSLLQSDTLEPIILCSNDAEVSPASRVPNTNSPSDGPTAHNKVARRRATKPKLRPRERAAFWSVPPASTPPATAFPTIDKTLQQTRSSLPAAAARQEFLGLLRQASEEGGRVVCVSGSTGCGKSTNLPQFVLENAPTIAKIVVTQPRRIAATGVAARVATERGEARPGVDSVGYVVRGDSALCNRTRLLFCTTGVLLRQLQTEGALSCITHIMIDEVHERHLDTDVVLGLLKKLLPRNPHLTIILMSATMDADRLAAYWGPNTPRMDIPGRTFPVKDHTLEDVLSLIRFVPSRKGRTKSPFSDEPDEEQPVDDDQEDDDTHQDESIDGIPVAELVKRVDETSIQYDIIARLVKHLVESKTYDDDGSILVFLPGAPEISKATDTIKRVCQGLSIVILPLHGGLQPKEQSRVFLSVPRGTSKIVLATNICQTSVTIPDCTVVIDTAKEKQSSYDPSNRMPLLVEKFASKADLMQRRGRAGRVREGVCYKLVSKSTLSRLNEHGDPEILRCALDQTLLSLLYMGIEDGTGNFMGTLLDPPGKASLDAAVFNLTNIGAVGLRDDDSTLQLTSLGVHLAGIPAPPSVGKMLVMGSILGCRSAAIAMAAGMSIDRSPFLRVDTFRGQRDEVSDAIDQAKSELVLKARSELFKKVGNSDHALLAAVFMDWEKTSPGAGSRKQFCDSLGLSFNGMRDISQLAQQLDASLSSIGFPASDDADRNANSWLVVRACAVAAMAPSQLVKVVRPETRYAETAEGAREKDGVARELKFFIRTESSREERVFVHPSSLNFSVGSFRCPWLVYHSLLRTSKPFLRDVTECSAYALLLFGGQLKVTVSLESAEVVVDGWAKLSANPAICSLVGSLREKVDALLSKKVDDPSFDVAGSTEMKLIVRLVRGDGHI